MKFWSLTLVLLLAGSFSAQAQRFGYVNTEYIMSKMPEYKAVQTEMDQLSAQWQKEYEDMRKKVETLYKKYQAEKVLLGEDIRIKREEEIESEEKKAAEFRAKKFGYNGDMFKMREEKLKPIQDKVFKAIEEAAKLKKTDLVLDKAGNTSILYTTPNYDLNDAVLNQLGIKADPNTGEISGPEKTAPPLTPGGR